MDWLNFQRRTVYGASTPCQWTPYVTRSRINQSLLLRIVLHIPDLFLYCDSNILYPKLVNIVALVFLLCFLYVPHLCRNKLHLRSSTSSLIAFIWFFFYFPNNASNLSPIVLVPFGLLNIIWIKFIWLFTVLYFHVRHSVISSWTVYPHFSNSEYLYLD